MTTLAETPLFSDEIRGVGSAVKFSGGGPLQQIYSEHQVAVILMGNASSSLAFRASDYWLAVTCKLTTHLSSRHCWFGWFA